jgi:LCP family protein required for cell wall assembly
MSERRRRDAGQGGEAYTGETIVMPRRRPPAPQGGEPPPPPPGYSRRPSARPAPRRARSLWGRLRLALGLLLVGLLVGAGLLYWQVIRLADAISVADVRNSPPIASPLIGANVLIVGVDERPGFPGEGVRSDTLILARLDAVGRWVSLLSIPRDTQASVADIGETKINVAYGQGYARAQELYGPEATPQQGGMALAAQTVEEFLQLRQRGASVDYVAQVNFDGFAGLVDALGGVTIDVPRLIVDDEYPTPDFGITRVEFQPGSQRMDGERALIYARTRHADSDFGRAQRQQQVIRAILSEFQSKSWPGRIAAVPALLGAVGGGEEGAPPVLTTMPIDRIDVLLGLLGLAGGLDPNAIGQLRLTPEEVAVYEDPGTGNLVWDPAGVQAQLDRLFAPPSEADEAAIVQVLNGTGTAGLARTVSIELERAGFTIVPPDNAPTGDYQRTVVYDAAGKPATARRLARTLDAELVSGPAPEYLGSADIVVILGANAAP